MLKQYEDNFSLSLVINLFDELIETGCYESVISKYEQFYEIVHRENLHNSYQLKPIIDGKTLAKELSRKPGPWMSVIIEKILVWQLDNPQLGQRECIEYVKSIIDDN
jgi:tRNA nucleotidyltransferase (CCA-adding enzyme)